MRSLDSWQLRNREVGPREATDKEHVKGTPQEATYHYFLSIMPSKYESIRGVIHYWSLNPLIQSLPRDHISSWELRHELLVEYFLPKPWWSLIAKSFLFVFIITEFFPCFWACPFFCVWNIGNFMLGLSAIFSGWSVPHLFMFYKTGITHWGRKVSYSPAWPWWGQIDSRYGPPWVLMVAMGLRLFGRIMYIFSQSSKECLPC